MNTTATARTITNNKKKTKRETIYKSITTEHAEHCFQGGRTESVDPMRAKTPPPVLNIQIKNDFVGRGAFRELLKHFFKHLIGAKKLLRPRMCILSPLLDDVSHILFRTSVERSFVALGACRPKDNIHSL